MKSAVCLSALAGVAIVTGCANGNAIYRKEALDSDSLVLDAKQRLVTNYDAKPWEVDPAVTENRKYGPPRYIAPERIVCPEPSPDVASSLSTAITASLNQINADGSRVSGDMGMATAESLAQLGQRLATTQLLRDELADLCRSYANGAISTTNYTLRLAQLDEKMVTLLTAEMIAGAFQRDSVILHGSTAFAGGAGGASPTKEQLDAASAEVTNARADLTTKSKALTDHLANTPKPPAAADTAAKAEDWRKANAIAIDVHHQQTNILRDDYNFAQNRVTRAVNEQAALQNAVGSGNAAPTARALALGGQAVSMFGGNADSAKQLVELQSNYLDRDKGGAIVDTCITRMNEDLLFVKGADPMEEKNKLLLTKQTALGDLRAEQAKRLADLDEPYLSAAEAASRDLFNLVDKPSDDPARVRAQKAFDDANAPLRKNARKMEAEYGGRMESLEREVADLERQIESGRTAVQLDFDALCYKFIEAFGHQSASSQDARMELELKELEAGVQKERAPWMSEQVKFCREHRAAVGDKPPATIDPIMENCSSILGAWNGPVLGDLTSLSRVAEDDSTDSSTDAYLIEYLQTLELRNMRLSQELQELRLQQSSPSSPSRPEPAEAPDDNGDL